MTTTQRRRVVSVPWLVAGLLAFAGLVALLTTGDEPAPVAPSQFGPVTVEGPALPADGSTGMAAPALAGVDVHRDPVRVEPGQATLLVFVAHWCPHCQVEVPRIVEWRRAGGGEALRLVAVSTGQDPSLPNWPATQWLETEGWPGAVILDDETGTAAKAFGVTAFPYFALLDADGTVRARASGELSVESLDAMAERV